LETRQRLAQGKWHYFNDTGVAYLEKEYVNGHLRAVRDLLKEDSMKKKDTANELPDRDEKESEFPGGPASWTKYLQKNLNYPQRAYSHDMQGKAVVQFVVDAAGVVQDIDIFKSVEFSLDEEAIRMIAKSPRWIPATQDGRKVKSYKRQPIVFGLQN
jgi:protein TonB